MIYLDSAALARLMAQQLEDRQVLPEAIGHVVGSQIQTSLRGVDSHGVNLFPHYCRAVDGGRINRTPKPVIEQTAASSAVMDADHAFGHHAGALAIDHAITIAQQTGMASVAVRNSTHFGAAAYFSLRAAARDCIGFSFCNADALVKVHNSTQSFFGTNPICFAAPMADDEPFSLDMATSLAAWNKVGNARRSGQAIPCDWAFDEAGKSTTDPLLARSLAPAGGYKGFDLGMMVDILCALLAGGPCSKDIPPMYGAPLDVRRGISHFFMVIDISRFVPVATFKRRLQDISDRIRAMTPAADADQPIMVAGDPEKQNHRRRLAAGIPMDEEKFSEFMQLSPTFEQARSPQ